MISTGFQRGSSEFHELNKNSKGDQEIVFNSKSVLWISKEIHTNSILNSKEIVRNLATFKNSKDFPISLEAQKNFKEFHLISNELPGFQYNSKGFSRPKKVLMIPLKPQWNSRVPIKSQSGFKDFF